MFNPFKTLFRRKNGGHDAPPIRPTRPISPFASSPLSGDIPSDNSKLNPQNSTFPLDPDNKRNGKIAKLPRPLRDQINRALDAGQSAVSIARGL